MKKILALTMLLLTACETPSPGPTTTTTLVPSDGAFVEVVKYGPLPVAGTHQNPKLINADGKLQITYIDRPAKKLTIAAVGVEAHAISFPITPIQQGLTKYQTLQVVGSQVLVFNKPELVLYSLKGTKEVLAKGYFEIYAGLQIGDKQMVIALGSIDGVTDPSPGKPWVFYRKVGDSAFKKVKLSYGTIFKLHIIEYQSKALVTNASGGNAAMALIDVDHLLAKNEIKLVAIKSTRDSQFWKSQPGVNHFADPMAVVSKDGPKLFSTVWDDKVVNMSNLIALGEVQDLPQNPYKLVATDGLASQVNHALPIQGFKDKMYFATSTVANKIQVFELGLDGSVKAVGLPLEGQYADLIVTDTLYVSTTQALYKLQ